MAESGVIEGEWAPAFPGQRPPFERGNEVGVETRFTPGNRANLRHGSYEEPLALSRDPRAAQLLNRIRETQPTSHPADDGAMERLALVYLRVDRSAAALERVDAEFADAPIAHYRDGSDFLARLRDDHARWLRLAGRIEAELGRTPSARAKLGLSIATAEREMSIVDYYRRRRELGLPIHDDDLDEEDDAA